MSVRTSLVFATGPYVYLQRAMCTGVHEPGEVEVRTFPDGERYHRIRSSVRDRTVAIVGGTIDDASTLDIYDLACGLVKEGARSLTLVLPYFGYSTMERAVKDGEIVTAKTRARLLSSIPHAPSGNRIVLLDLHAQGIAHYFEGDVRPIHVSARAIIGQATRDLVRDLVGAEPSGSHASPEFVVASTDAGRAKWVQELANDLGVVPSFVFKRRLEGDRTEVIATSAQVSGRTVVLYDDMIRTGSSLIGAARAYRDAGATRLAAITTHGVFAPGSLDRIRAAGLFERILSTDSHPNAVRSADDFLRIVSVAELLTAHL